MTNSTRKHIPSTRLTSSLKIATFVAVAAFMTLVASPHTVTPSAPELAGFDEGGYMVTLPTSTAMSSSTAIESAATKAADYFPSQFEIKGVAADPSMPTF